MSLVQDVRLTHRGDALLLLELNKLGVCVCVCVCVYVIVHVRVCACVL